MPPPPPPKSAPDEIVAITTGDALVVLDPSDGSVVRTLMPAQDGRTFASLSLSPDGTTAYVQSRREGDENSRILAVRTDRSESFSIVAEGGNPVLSPDGKKLAITRLVGRGASREAIAVRTLATGSERVWTREEGDHIGGMYFAGWLPDSQRFLFGEFGADPPGNIAGVVDIDEPGEVLQTRAIGPLYGAGPEKEDGGWGAWVFGAPRASELVVAAKMGTGGDSPTRLETVDVETLRRVDVLVETKKEFFELDFDATGRHLLAVGRPWETSRGSWRSMRAGMRVYRWHGEQFIVVARDVKAAVW